MSKSSAFSSNSIQQPNQRPKQRQQSTKQRHNRSGLTIEAECLPPKLSTKLDILPGHKTTITAVAGLAVFLLQSFNIISLTDEERDFAMVGLGSLIALFLSLKINRNKARSTTSPS